MQTFDKTTLLSYGENTIRLLHLLDQADISTWHAFILYTIKNYSLVEQKITFKRLENYIMRRFIVGVSSKNYNKVAASLIVDLQNPSVNPKIDPFHDVPNDDDVRIALHNPIKSKKASLLLLWVELARRHNPKADASHLVITDKFTLEHILPQEWRNSWKILGGALAEERREAHVHLIGNMTIVTGSNNGGMGNGTFASKKEAMLQFADLTITKEVLALDDWNEETIANRTEALSQEILKLWPANPPLN